MKFLLAAFLCLGVASAYPLLYAAQEDGQYRGEGLVESQDFGQYNYGSAYGYDDGQYKGEGLAESQDFGQYNPAIYGAAFVGAPAVYAAGPIAYAHGGAPIGIDGRVVDTPEVAHAKAAHFAAKAVAGSHSVYGGALVAAPAVYAAGPAVYAASPVAYAAHYTHGGAPIGLDGRVVDTPEVAHAKAAHFAAKAAAGAHHY